MQFIHKLEKGSRKHPCPQCRKKTFVRYVNIETNEYLAPEFGRCDRESKCGYFSCPTGNFQKESYNTPVSTPKPSYHPLVLVEKSGRNFRDNNFVCFLQSIFSEDQVKEVILKYLIGTSKLWNGATVFWQIDELEKVRHGKIMLYDKLTGKRKKGQTGKAYISSVRAVLKLENFNLQQCLFGLHLINEQLESTIAIVESEKTAIIMSIFKPQYLWLATGSKNGFKYEFLKPLRKRKVIAFPDKSEYADWLVKSLELKKLGFDISVSKYLEDSDYPSGTDLADAYVSELNSPSIVQPIEAVRTETETVINKWAEQKPEIWKLIEAFDLKDHNGREIKKR